MKKFFFLLLIFNFNSYSQSFPNNYSDLEYFSMGSCETNNLSFNAARFTKIPTGELRDGLDVYLQIILFLNADHSAIFRVMKQGLINCKNEVCSYKPFVDTKLFFNSSWILENNTLKIDQLGKIEKIRDDFPWLGFNLTIIDDFKYEAGRNLSVLGGKIQINFNHEDINVARICK